MLDLLPDDIAESDILVKDAQVRRDKNDTLGLKNEKKVTASFRVKGINTLDGVENFFQEFNQKNNTHFNLTNNPDRKGKLLLWSGFRKCHHNVREQKKKTDFKNEGKTGKVREEGKNTLCDASINFKIHKPNKILDKEYPLEIYLVYVHNHNIEAADCKRFLPVAESVKTVFEDMFEDGCSPAEAYRNFIESLENEDDRQDRSKVPDKKWVYNFFDTLNLKKYGTAAGPDVVEKANKIIEDLNKRNNETVAQLIQIDNGDNEPADTIIVTCLPFERRVHSSIPAAGDLVEVDLTSNVDRHNSQVCHLVCPSPVGLLPLGTIITTRYVYNLN